MAGTGSWNVERVARGLAHRVKRLVSPGGFDADLIHAVKNELVGEVSGVKGQLHAADAGQRALQDQQAMAGTRLEVLLNELLAVRDEVGFARNDVLTALERVSPTARVTLEEVRLADLDAPTAGFLNYARSHRGPLADVGLWLNEPVVVEWLDGDARVGAVNERIVEVPFVHRSLADLDPGSRVLDIGGGESLVGLALASSGHDVTVLEPAGYPYRHPGLTVAEETLEAHRPDAPFDAIILLSAIEHFGIGAYANNGELDEDADLAAMNIVRGLLAPDGIVVLTTPFGPAAVNELERTYDESRLRKLLSGFDLLDTVVASRVDHTTWTVTGHDLATPADSGHVVMVRARPAQ